MRLERFPPKGCMSSRRGKSSTSDEPPIAPGDFMSLYFVVQLESKSPQGEDDGDSAWRSTAVAFGHGRFGVVSEVSVDGYSGRVWATVTRDDFELPTRLAQPLAVAIYRECGSAMRHADC